MKSVFDNKKVDLALKRVYIFKNSAEISIEQCEKLVKLLSSGKLVDGDRNITSDLLVKQEGLTGILVNEYILQCHKAIREIEKHSIKNHTATIEHINNERDEIVNKWKQFMFTIGKYKEDMSR